VTEKNYLNAPGNEVPKNTIMVVPHSLDNDGFYKDVIVPLKGVPKRDWFTSHFYYCLPLSVGNQYGFMVQSARDFDVVWYGGLLPAVITFKDDEEFPKQFITNGFGSGIITIQNHFALKTPPGINLMTIQPPNMFIEGCVAMTGVIETDNIRRDFTFNLKVTIPNYTISVKKGDPLGAFIPVPRYFVEGFNLELIQDKDLHENEVAESSALGKERSTDDLDKPHMAGRRYFKGVHLDDSPYPDHQRGNLK